MTDAQTSSAGAWEVRGSRFVLPLVAVMLVVSGLIVLGLRESQHRRFAVSLSSMPQHANPKAVSVDRPLVLRIDHTSSKGRNLVALGVLLDADGNPLSELTPLQAVPNEHGKVLQQVVFPPLGKVPVRGLVSGVVMRLEKDTPQAREQLWAALEGQKIKQRQLAKVFTRVIVAARELGGHAEQAQREVKPESPSVPDGSH
ncbi:MAG TPA: hypothetical protein PKE31_10815 [Pseudomonadota bacterium]|nr:hypothetical protein [Pseudomonadota bacterium]